MATLNTRSFTTLIQNQATAIQARASALIDLSIGSILRAVIESNASVVLWLQGLILQVLLVTRAATSTGDDLDSFVNDYGLTRLAAVASAGNVTFSRFTATAQAVIPVGTTVQTGDGSQTFSVIADVTNTAYSALLSGYVLAAGAGSLTVPVKANTPSAASNVVAGAVSVMVAPISGVDTVANASAMAGGGDAEADTALRVRFRAYIASLAKATKQAIAYAIQSVQLGIQYTITENLDYAGNSHPGYFTVVVDNGTGNASSTLLTAVYTAVDAARPLGVLFGVFAPTIVTANVALTVSVVAGFDATTVRNAVNAAITAYVNGLGLGNSLYYNRLSQVIFDASAGVQNITGFTVNSAALDVTATAQQSIKSGLIVVN